MAKPQLWGIHAGRTGDANTLFLQGGVIAIGWEEMGDLSALPAAREAFKAKLLTTYPSTKPGAVAGAAGQLFRFVHEITIGDLVAYPSKLDKRIHIGRVAGQYHHEVEAQPTSYPHRRPVVWSRSLPRTAFSQGALYEAGSAMSLFQINNYADEFMAVTDSPTEPLTVGDDETVTVVSEDIEQSTRDFILKRLQRDLKGHPFAELVGHLLTCMGYRATVSQPGIDHGVDVVAHRDELGFEPPIIKVQVKSGQGSVGEPDVAQLYGNVGLSEFGLFISLGGFTVAAKGFARDKTNLRLVDVDGLIDLLLEHYQRLDPRYQGLMPLKRVYIPEGVAEDP